MPIVYVSRYLRGDDLADRVVNADVAAMRQATARLIGLGHRDLVLVGGQPGTTVAEDRVAGFRAELEAASMDWADDLWLRCRPRLVEGAAALPVALARHPVPTGFVCFNDLVAFGVMNAMRARGIEPGRDVGVVALGGTEEDAAFFPGLTTVLDDPGEIGRLAAEILRARLDRPDGPPRHVTLKPKLTIRGSCGEPIA